MFIFHLAVVYIDHKWLFKNIKIKKLAALCTIYTFNFYTTCTFSTN